ncbi:hypothetical protein B0H19DRAFT_1038001 [Mycena capillaripes]|nr:hypothetical protein B0H19DRAFT_1038001 [Mycena capillaripes]
MSHKALYPIPRGAVASQNILNHTFNSVGGDMTQVNVTSYGESGIDILYRCISIEALHDSGERFPEPACHPGTRTRTAVLDQLRTWSLDKSPDSTLLWLNGTAGAGKSAIPQMFAGDCQTREQLGGSFFFRRGHPTRGTWNCLFTAVAYQLATLVPELLLPIQQAVENDRLIAGRAMPVQFQRLLVEPFRNAPRPKVLPIIVIDGLDECQDHKIQQQIVHLFMKAIRAGYFPARLLIASRPEPHLREILETDESSAMCRHSELSTDASAYADIRIYLPFTEGDSPLDFLADPLRAGSLYCNPQDTAEEIALCWISRAKDILCGRSDFWLDKCVRVYLTKLPYSLFGHHI